MFRSMSIAVCALLLSFSALASETIVDTGPTDGSRIGVFNDGPLDFQSIAGRFELTSRYTLTDLEGMFHLNGAAGIKISVFSSTNNSVGQELASASVYREGENTSSWWGLNDVSWTFDPGSYWIVFAGVPGQPTYASMPYFGSINPLSGYRVMNALNGLPPQWLDLLDTTQVGVRIQGNLAPVPEPSVAVLTLLGIGLVGLRMQRRRT